MRRSDASPERHRSRPVGASHRELTGLKARSSRGWLGDLAVSRASDALFSLLKGRLTLPDADDDERLRESAGMSRLSRVLVRAEVARIGLPVVSVVSFWRWRERVLSVAGVWRRIYCVLDLRFSWASDFSGWL
jgi:hypothetical protein